MNSKEKKNNQYFIPSQITNNIKRKSPNQINLMQSKDTGWRPQETRVMASRIQSRMNVITRNL